VSLDTRRLVQRASRGDVLAGIRPEDLTWNPRPGGQHVRATVELVEPMGHEAYVTARAGHTELVARFPPRSGVTVHQTVELGFDPDRLHLFDRQSGDSLLAPHVVEAGETPRVATPAESGASPAR